MIILKTINFLGTSSNEKKTQNIMKLRSDFQKREVVTVLSAVKKYGYTEETIIRWAKEGDIPIFHNGKPVVRMHVDNKPKWW